MRRRIAASADWSQGRNNFVIEAFFFGPDESRVFATYHPPADGSGRALTVICPPLFSEYMRTQLALRQVAIGLAEQGHHVLRIDYRGTGDSYGELASTTISDWVADVALAVQEGRDLTGNATIRLLGVRAGALLACKAAGSLQGINRVVLWDPVPDGEGYLKLLRRLQADVVARNLYLNRAVRREALGECAGYVLSPRMIEEFRQLDAATYGEIPKDSLRVVLTSPHTAAPVPGVTGEVTPFICNWETATDDLLVPRPVMERLIACLVQS